MKFKQQGALHLFALVAMLATMIGIAFTALYFLDRATLNRAHNDRELSARASNPQVRPMTVDNATQKKPLNINDALEILNQPELDNTNTAESTGSESGDSQATTADDTGSDQIESTPAGLVQELPTVPNDDLILPAADKSSAQ